MAPLVPAARAPAFAQRFLAAQPAPVFGMGFALAQRAVVRREERAARWRLELAETRTHPFQLAKIFPALFPAVHSVQQNATNRPGPVPPRYPAVESCGWSAVGQAF